MDKSNGLSAKSEQEKRQYTQPSLKNFGDLRELSKGQLAYSQEEGFFQEMNPPS